MHEDGIGSMTSIEGNGKASFTWVRVGAGEVVVPAQVDDTEGVQLLERPGRWLATRGHWLVTNAGSLVAAVGLGGILAYGILWLAYSRFYQGLGLRPEDVGLTYPDILSHSIAGMMLATVVTLDYILFDSLALIAPALLVGAVLTMVGILSHWVARRLLRRFRTASFDQATQACLFISCTLIAYMATGMPRAASLTLPAPADSPLCRSVIWIAGLVLLLAGTGWLVQYVSPCRPHWGRWSLVWQVIQWLTANKLFLVAAFFVSAMAFDTVLLFRAADVVVAETRSGETAGFQSFGVDVVSWNVEPATVYWSASAPRELIASRSGHCLMYVGRTGDTVAFYDSSSKEALRVPSQFVTVAVRNKSTKCP